MRFDLSHSHRICCKVRCITYRQQIDQVEFEHYRSFKYVVITDISPSL